MLVVGAGPPGSPGPRICGGLSGRYKLGVVWSDTMAGDRPRFILGLDWAKT